MSKYYITQLKDENGNQIEDAELDGNKISAKQAKQSLINRAKKNTRNSRMIYKIEMFFMLIMLLWFYLFGLVFCFVFYLVG